MRAHDFSDLVASRYTARDFRSDPVRQATLDAILDDARHAPSWSNTRPYQIAIASGSLLSKISDAYLEEYEASLGLQRKQPTALMKALVGIGVPRGDYKVWKRYPPELRARSRKVGKGLYTHMGVPRGDSAAREAAVRRNFQFFGAPTVLWVLANRRMLPVSAMDAGLMLQTLILSAKAHGVDSCPIGALAIWRKPLEQAFEVPRGYRVMTGLALGYASADPVNDFRAEHPPLSRLTLKS